MNLDIKPKKKDKLADQLYNQILDWIISGELKEGDKVPSENQLCKSFEVSRPVVREALLKLQEADLVATKKGIGSFVLHSPLEKLNQYASANDIAVILQSHEVRIAIEGEAAYLAATRRTEEQLNDLKAAVLAMETDFKSHQLSIHADYKFHIGIAKAAKNKIFVDLLENADLGLTKTMAVAQQLSRASVKNKIFPNRNKNVLKEHQLILDAIENQDQEGARFAMRNHITKIKERIINMKS